MQIMCGSGILFYWKFGLTKLLLSLILTSIPEVILSLSNTNAITSRMHLRFLLGFVLIEPDLSDLKTVDIGILVFWSWCSVWNWLNLLIYPLFWYLVSLSGFFILEKKVKPLCIYICQFIQNEDKQIIVSADTKYE